MLTFYFDGVSGKMIREEILTAGMVGKEVAFTFSEDWEGLRKVAVYQAGDVAATTVELGETDIIPAAVLSESLKRLYVGVYGVSEDGTVVIPAIYARGPFIHIGTAEEEEAPGYVPETPFWLELEETVDQTLRYTPQELSEEEKQQARQNIGAVGEDPETAQLLVTVLQNGVYSTDQQENIIRLTAALCGSVIYNISVVLDRVTINNRSTVASEGSSYQAVLTAEDGYELSAVTVSVNGEDVTDSVYADGIIRISALTGDLEICAAAVEKLELCVEGLGKGAVSFSSTKGMVVNGTSVWGATVIPVGQYLKNGETYRFGLRCMYSTYCYAVQVFTASGAGLTFPHVTGTNTYYDEITGLVMDSGWVQADCTYTAGQDDLVVAVNLRRVDGQALTEEDYEFLLANCIMETV